MMIRKSGFRFSDQIMLNQKPCPAMPRTSPSALRSTILALFVAAAPLALLTPVHAQQDSEDPEMRIEQLEARLRQLTGQNEELQYRNHQLEEQIRQLQAGQGGRTSVATAPQSQPAYPSQPTYQPPGPQAAPPYPQGQVQQQPQPQPVEQARIQTAPPAGRPRGDAFDPAANPNAPGAPRPLGSIVGQPPAPLAPQSAPDVGAPGGRGAGEPLDLANTNAPRGTAAGQPASQAYPQQQGYPQQGYPQGTASRPAPAGPQVATLPPTNSPRDEFDLGYGYVERKDYALADQTLRAFLQKYPSDRLAPEAHYWLGESLYQRQRYRDAAESFLTVTTKFDSSVKAPDALLRLGQSLAALKEKEAACAAFGEVTRKFPKASAAVKQSVDREQKRVHC
jgi:tol-pal system protein YbgF